MAETQTPAAAGADAAEKAYAAASEQATIAKTPAPKAEAPAPVVEAAPTKPAAKAPAAAAKPAPAKKAVARKPAKRVVKAKPAAKAIVKKAVRSAAKPVVSKPAVIKPTTIQKDIKTMATTAKKTTTDFTAKITDAVKDAQDRAKTAFEKSQAAMGDAGQFSKGNLEAVVESGKILSNGMQAMGKTYVAEVKSTFEAIQKDVKELTAVKTPSEFVELQGKLLRKYFDNAVAYNSKNAEAALKLANDAFQPISNRVSLAVEKVRKAA